MSARFACDVCGYVAESEAAAASHKQYIHGLSSDDQSSNQAQSDACHGRDDASSVTQRGTELGAHKSTHTAEKRYLCHECDYRTTTAQLLKQHIARRHTGERPHRCDQCSAAFLAKNELANHKVSHTGEKPFMCEVCGFSTSTKRALNRHHRLKHTGEDRLLKCDLCD